MLNETGAFGFCLFIIFFGAIAAFIFRISSGIFKMPESLDSSTQMLQIELDRMGHCFEQPFQQLRTFDTVINVINKAYRVQIAIFIHIFSPYAFGIIFLLSIAFIEVKRGTRKAINNYSFKKYLQETGEMAMRFG